MSIDPAHESSTFIGHRVSLNFFDQIFLKKYKNF